MAGSTLFFCFVQIICLFLFYKGSRTLSYSFLMEWHFEVNMIDFYVDWLQWRGRARYFDALGAVNTKDDGR